MVRWRRDGLGCCLLVLLGAWRGAAAQGLVEPRALVAEMITRERAAAEHKDRYEYLSKERSTRTGGHLWTERVVETGSGKVRMLIGVDGGAPSGEVTAAERSRLADILKDQAGFAKREQAARNDELHAKDMLELLPRAFLFENARMEGEFERIDYRPNPQYQPRNLEERVLHAMLGSLLVDVKAVRMRQLDGHLGEDVSIGFGLLATVKAGSRFLTERQAVEGGEWKTTRIDVDVNGRAMFFKTIGKNEQAEHGEFRRVPDGMSVVDAVALVER